MSLGNYHPLMPVYDKLWLKFQSAEAIASAGQLPIPVIQSQEESIQASLKLKGALETLAKTQDKEVAEITKDFIDASQKPIQKGRTKLETALIAISNEETAKEIMGRFQLIFDFNTVDDLFLSDESDKSSVFSFE